MNIIDLVHNSHSLVTRQQTTNKMVKRQRNSERTAVYILQACDFTILADQSRVGNTPGYSMDAGVQPA